MSHDEYSDCINAAMELGRSGCSCSEAIACAFGRKLKIDDRISLSGATPLAGGMGLSGQTCGVVGAALMIVGWALGPDSTKDQAGRQRAIMAGVAFTDAFEAANGSTLCSNLCEGDLRSPEGAKALRASGQPEIMIRSGATILAKLLSED